MAKYGNTRTDGFSSKLEAAVCQVLLARQSTGEISNIQQQVTVELTEAKLRYKIDFSYEVMISKKHGAVVYVEAKGVSTDRWKICEKLWPYYGPGKLEIWKGSYQAPTLVETITPTRRK